MSTMWMNFLKYLTVFKNLICSITITNILEILVLAFLVYNVLLWIKNSKAWTLLRGIIVLIVFASVVYVLNMDTLVYLMSRLLDTAIVAVVVIFQPELRRALEQLGEKPFFGSFLDLVGVEKEGVERFSDKTVNEIIKASVEMSKIKTGALIVVTQNNRLDEYERTGIVLDSVLTSQLLINIFEHNTPLHDGAVIVKGNRITAATCYLPLSDNMMLSKELGTRHRAGVGISEVTDSLTIIVSEETGAISMAYKGKLQRHVDADDLRKKLEVLQNKQSITGKFRFPKGRNKDEA